MVPLPEVDSFDELNQLLLEQCLADDARCVERQPVTIGEAFEQERPCLRALPAHDFDCCTRRLVVLNPYSQIVFETNRYSVPVEEAHRNLLVKAYPFHVQILRQDRVLCVHERSYDREVDVIDPLHYLPLLEQHLGAFEHAKPLRLWRAQWPPVYEDHDLIILDELGFIPLTATGAQLLFQFCSTLYEHMYHRRVQSYQDHPELEALERRVRQLHAEAKMDHEIAEVLNAEGVTSARGRPFNNQLIWLLRKQWGLPTVQPKRSTRLRWEDGCYTVEGVAQVLGVFPGTVYKWLRQGKLKGHQLAQGTPWKIGLTEEEIAQWRAYVERVRRSKKEVS